MLVNIKEMLKKAYEGKYAVGQFNINNLEWTKFILEECEKNESPVILGVSEGAAKYMGGYKVVYYLVGSLINELKIKVPVALHLDHGSSVDSCKAAIDAGFTSVMIDASKHDLEINIQMTKEVVDYAQQKNVTVEAELGHIGGNEDGVVGGILYAEVKDCKELALKTNIDMLAPALGSVHGLYNGTPNLNFERMKEIEKELKMPLVLHGGTGIYDDQIKEAISCGVCKININTEFQIAWANEVRKFIEMYKDIYDPRKIIKSGEMAMKEVVSKKIELFGSQGKAKR